MNCRLDVNSYVHRNIKETVGNIGEIDLRSGEGLVNGKFGSENLKKIKELNDAYKEKVITYTPSSDNDLPGRIIVRLSDRLYDHYLKKYSDKPLNQGFDQETYKKEKNFNNEYKKLKEELVAGVEAFFKSNGSNMNSLENTLNKLSLDFGIQIPNLFDILKTELNNYKNKPVYSRFSFYDKVVNKLFPSNIINTQQKLLNGSYRGNVMFQLDSNLPKNNIKELDDYLIDFLKKNFNVSFKQFEELKSRLGTDSLGATDVLNKLIWYVRERNEETIPEEVGHIVVTLMGEKHPDIADLVFNINTWSEYPSIYAEYMPLYQNEDKVKIEAIGKLLAKSLVKNYKAVGINKSLIEKVIESIKKLINSLDISTIFFHNQNIADHISLNILSGNTDYIRKITNYNPNLNFKKEVDSNPFAKKLIYLFSNKNVNLTGSLAIAAHGENIRRAEGQGVHDLDFKVNGFNNFNEDVLPKLKKLNAIPAHYGWHKPGYSTYAYLITQPNYRIEVITRKDDFSNGWITAYNLYDEKNQQVEITQQNVVSLDFFIYKDGNKQVFDDKTFFSPASSVYEGKMSLNGLSNPYLFNREKDQEDYVLRKPTDFASQENTIFRQIEGTESSIASPETISKVKAVLEKMGVSLKELEAYLKGNPIVGSQGINALADLSKGIIAVAKGREDIALTEEMVHIATAIIEQKNPKLITEMISKIDRFSIYKKTLEQYKNNPNYQTFSGKPDIRKIKKEAVDKLIAELIINNSQGSEQFPELLDETNRSWVRRIWESILDWFRNEVKNSNIDIFTETSNTIMNEDFGNVSDISANDVFFQISDAQKDFQQKVRETNNTIVKVSEEVAESAEEAFLVEEKESNWYEKVADGSKVKKRVTDRVKSWYRDKFRGTKPPTAKEKAFNEFKRDSGIKYHGFFEEMHQRYYNEDGTKKQNIALRPFIQNPLDRQIYSKLEKYYTDLIASFSKDGATPLVFSEMIVYDSKQDEAGTLDLIIVDENGQANVFDWKFMSIAAGATDVAWYKQSAYNIQLGRYKKILKDYYGIKSFGKIRAIPIIFDVKRVNSKKEDSPLYINAINIGSVDTSKIEDLTLIPISEESESTGIDAIDSLLKDLNNVYEQISDKDATNDEERDFKRERLNIIKRAARTIQGTLNVGPLIDVVAVMKKEGENIIEDYNAFFKGQDPRDPKFTKKQLSDFSRDLQDYLAISVVFSNLQDTIAPLIYNEEGSKLAKTKEEKQAWAYRKEMADKVSKQSADIRQSNIAIKELSKEFADKFIGIRNLVEGLTENNVELRSFGAFFRGISDLNLPSLSVLFKLITNAKGQASREAFESTEELMKIREALSKKTDNLREYVKKIYQKDDKNNFVNKLIYKYDKSFYEAVDNNALEANQSRKWLLENIDVESYKKEADVLLAKKIKGIRRTYNDDKIVKKLVSEAILEFDTSRVDFQGFNNYLLKRHPLEKWTSKEYKELQEDPDLLALYNYVTKVNEVANEIGYIDHRVKNTFLPFVRKSMAESLAWDFNLSALSNWTDKLKVRVDDVGFGKINELTKELESSIPKYYTTDFTTPDEDGNRDVSDVSEDIFKNLILYSSHVQKYKYLSEIEGQLTLVKKIETFKGHIQTNSIGRVVLDANDEPIDIAGNDSNVKLYEQFLNSLLYDQKYAITSTDIPLNIGKGVEGLKKLVTAVTGRKFEENENPSATSLIKLVDAGNKYYQLKTLGFEFLSGAANLFGTSIQISTQSGNYFKAREFAKNAAMLVGNKYSQTEERDVFVKMVDVFMPLKDDPNYEKIKEAGMTKLTQTSFSDMLMVFMRLPEYHVEKTIFLTLLQNTMVVDGKFVNIREYAKNKYSTRNSSAAEYRRTKILIEEEINTLKEKSSVYATKKLVDDKLVIPGFDMENQQELQKLTNLTRRLSRNATGSMSDSDLNRAGMNIWSKSAMVFKGWIPKLVDTRFGEFRKTSDDFAVEIDENGAIIGEKYDIGRIRLLGYVIGTSIRDKSFNIINLLNYNDKGVLLIDKMYDDYAKDYKLRTGKELNMTKDDFTDLIRTNLRNQIKELSIALILLSGSMLMVPPDDVDKATRNRYRFYQKVIDRFIDELLFFYSPFEWNSMLSRNPIPVLGIATDVKKFTSHLFMETTGLDLTDLDATPEEVMKNAQPIKYGARLIPFAKSAINYGAMLDSEFAKEFDITIQKNNRN